MLIEHFKPLRNLVLVKTDYKVKGFSLVGNHKEVSMNPMDKTAVAVGPDVVGLKVGDCIDDTCPMCNTGTQETAIVHSEKLLGVKRG